MHLCLERDMMLSWTMTIALCMIAATVIALIHRFLILCIGDAKASLRRSSAAEANGHMEEMRRVDSEETTLNASGNKRFRPFAFSGRGLIFPSPANNL
jgi:hypothetical protein